MTLLSCTTWSFKTYKSSLNRKIVLLRRQWLAHCDGSKFNLTRVKKVFLVYEKKNNWKTFCTESHIDSYCAKVRSRVRFRFVTIDMNKTNYLKGLEGKWNKCSFWGKNEILMISTKTRLHSYSVKNSPRENPIIKHREVSLWVWFLITLGFKEFYPVIYGQTFLLVGKGSGWKIQILLCNTKIDGLSLKFSSHWGAMGPLPPPPPLPRSLPLLCASANWFNTIQK